MGSAGSTPRAIAISMFEVVWATPAHGNILWEPTIVNYPIGCIYISNQVPIEPIPIKSGSTLALRRNQFWFCTVVGAIAVCVGR